MKDKTAQENFFLRGIIHITPIVVLAVVLLGVVAITSSKETETPLTTEKQGVVKSEEDDSSGSGSSGSSEDEDEDSSGSGSSGSSDDEDSSGSGSSGSDDNDDSSGSGSGDEDEDGEDNSGPGSTSSGSGGGDEDEEERTEFRFSSGLRIKTRERDDRRRVDIYEGGRKLRIETRDGRTIVKVENEEGEEIGEDEFEGDDEIDLGATRGGELRVRTRRNRFVVSHGRIEAHTDFPLSVDTQTNELTVTTPAGSRVVTILPQQAVDNMLAGNVIDTVLSTLPTPISSPGTSPVATTEAEILGQVVELEEDEDGELVYNIEGARGERLLGLFDVFIPKTVLVSAETGELVGVRQSVLSRVLDLISF